VRDNLGGGDLSRGAKKSFDLSLADEIQRIHARRPL
jgi:hypothetical protein